MPEIVKFLMSVHDPRDHRKVHHLLSDIVLLIFFARLAGAEYWEEIEEFGLACESSLRAILKLDNGIPSHDTIQRVFATLDAQVLVTVTRMWANLLEEANLSTSSFPTFAKSLIAIDGKTIKGNASQTQKALHIVSAYATERGICYGQVAIDEKSNEITAIAALLDKLSVKGCLISCDAIGTQKAIANKIVQKQANYCLTVKENQKCLLEDIVPFFEDKEAISDTYETLEKAHGQIERRTYEVVSDTAWLRQEHSDWPHIQSLGRVTCQCQKGNKENVETRYFILSTQVSGQELAACVRGHWKVESLHWQLDVVFREDANKTLNKQLAFNLNVMDKFCLAVLKQLDVGKKMSLRRKKFHLSLYFDKYLRKLI